MQVLRNVTAQVSSLTKLTPASSLNLWHYYPPCQAVLKRHQNTPSGSLPEFLCNHAARMWKQAPRLRKYPAGHPVSSVPTPRGMSVIHENYYKTFLGPSCPGKHNLFFLERLENQWLTLNYLLNLWVFSPAFWAKFCPKMTFFEVKFPQNRTFYWNSFSLTNSIKATFQIRLGSINP